METFGKKEKILIKITEDYIRALISKKSFTDENFPCFSISLDSEKAEHKKFPLIILQVLDDIADNMLLDSSEK